MLRITEKPFVPPRVEAINARLASKNTFEKLKGPLALIITHLNSEHPRDAIVSKVGRADLMNGQLTVEVMQDCEDPFVMRETKDHTLLIGDPLGGAEALGAVLEKQPLTRRFILTGTYVEACIFSMLEKIIDEKIKGAGDLIEIYLPADGLLSSQDNETINSIQKLKQIAAVYFKALADDYPTSIWLDDQLTPFINSETPKIRLRFYSSMEQMLKALG